VVDMRLARDVLDKAIVDRNGREMGRADGIVLELREGEPPRVAAIQVGPSVLGHRLGARIGRWIEALEHAFGVDEGRPVRIEFSDVVGNEKDIKVDVALGETAAGVVEQKLRAWVARLPGSG
jgi:sporulation protein YlmC with PRC-barrel domain